VTRYLLVKGVAGLGNRVAALLQAIVYARLTDRALVVDWNDSRYSSDRSDVFRRLFECPLAHPLESLPRNGSVVPSVWSDLRMPVEGMRRRLDIAPGSAETRRRLSIDTARLDYVEQIAVFTDFGFHFDALAGHSALLPPQWRGLVPGDLAKRLLHDHLLPERGIREAEEAFRRRCFGSTTIGVHVRHTDNMEARMLGVGKRVALRDLEHAVADRLRSVPESTLLVATDNRSVLEAFQARHERVVSYEKWFPADGGALHGHKGCPDKLAMARDALVEVLLLSQCDVLVHSSRSSFSRLARLLDRNPEQVEVDIEAKRAPQRDGAAMVSTTASQGEGPAPACAAEASPPSPAGRPRDHSRALAALVRELRVKLADARSRQEVAERSHGILRQQHLAILGSRTWRWTRPIRGVADRIKRLLAGPRRRGLPRSARGAGRSAERGAWLPEERLARRVVLASSRRLFELGFTERPLAELRALMVHDPDPRVRRLAARELAKWHANQRTATGAARCLELLEHAAVGEGDPTRLRQAALLAAESHATLGDVERGRQVIEDALRSGLHVDLLFAAANLEAAAPDRIPWINQAFRLYGLAEICLDEPAGGAPLDRLSVVAPLRGQPHNAPAAGLPKVSVLVAARNAADVIGTALDSLSTQTWSHLEVLVVDDGSSDATREVADERARRDPRIRVLRLPSSRGPYVARNLALQAAAGDLVTCHDADDWSHPEKIEKQVQHLFAHAAVVANTSQHARATADLRFFRRGNYGYYVSPAMSSLMFRRAPVMEALGCWDSVRFGADAELIRRARRVFGADSVVDLETGPLTFLRSSASSLTGNPVFGFHGYPMGARREYLESQRDFHARNAGLLRYEFPQRRRPFAVPAPLWPEPPEESERCFDVILASDYRHEDAADGVEVELLARLGLRVGLVQLATYETSPRLPIASRVRDLVDGDRVQLLVYGESVSCRLLVVVPPQVLEERQRFLPAVQAGEIHVVAVDSPARYELRTCAERVREYWGRGATWHPANSSVRAALQERQADIPELEVAGEDWSTLLALMDD
jgi:glycosyltransferase involved in cell wall biosynthesis